VFVGTFCARSWVGFMDSGFAEEEHHVQIVGHLCGFVNVVPELAWC